MYIVHSKHNTIINTIHNLLYYTRCISIISKCIYWYNDNI